MRLIDPAPTDVGNLTATACCAFRWYSRVPFHALEIVVGALLEPDTWDGAMQRLSNLGYGTGDPEIWSDEEQTAVTSGRTLVSADRAPPTAVDEPWPDG